VEIIIKGGLIMHKFTFTIKEDDDEKSMQVYHNIEIQYSPDDYSLVSVGGGCGTILVFNNATYGLGFDPESRRICGIGDYFMPLNNIQAKDIEFTQESIDVILYINPIEVLFSRGIGYAMKFSNKIYFDREKGILQFGKIDINRPNYRFLKNAYAQLENGELQGIIITGIM
jgi:hypothetical protein